VTERALLWEAIADEVGEPATRSERGRMQRAVIELYEIGASADDVRARSRRYQELWPHIVLTATALAANWSLLDPARRTQSERDDDALEHYNRA
jgi:hypothetical protein